jgi:hypothetical protein
MSRLNMKIQNWTTFALIYGFDFGITKISVFAAAHPLQDWQFVVPLRGIQLTLVQRF